MRRHFSHKAHGMAGRRSYDRGERGLYRSRNGIILGVFKGLANHFDFSVGWLRAIGVIVFMLTGLWPIVVLYLLAALLMKPEPVIPLQSLDDKEFYDSYAQSRRGAVHRMKRQFDNLNRRIQRMEDVVTDKEFEWEQKFNA